MANNLTAKTLDWCKKIEGWEADKAEYWLPSHAARAVIDAAKRVDRATGWDELQEAIGRYERSGPGVRKDLFGFVDVVAISDDAIIAIQSTSYSHAGARVAKIQSNCRSAAIRWVRAGGRIEVWGWKQYTQAVDRRKWRPRRISIELRELQRAERAPF